MPLTAGCLHYASAWLCRHCCSHLHLILSSCLLLLHVPPCVLQPVPYNDHYPGGCNCGILFVAGVSEPSVPYHACFSFFRNGVIRGNPGIAQAHAFLAPTWSIAHNWVSPFFFLLKKSTRFFHEIELFYKELMKIYAFRGKQFLIYRWKLPGTRFGFSFYNLYFFNVWSSARMWVFPH